MVTVSSSTVSARDKAVEAQRKFVRDRGGVLKPSDMAEYNKLRKATKEAGTLEAYERAGISKPVVKQSNETTRQAVQRSATETAELAVKNQPEGTTATVQVSEGNKDGVRFIDRDKLGKPSILARSSSGVYSDGSGSLSRYKMVKEEAAISQRAVKENKPTGNFWQRTTTFLSSERDKAATQVKFYESSDDVFAPAKGTYFAAKSFGLGVISMPINVISAVTNPIQTFQSVKETIKDPYRTIGVSIARDPFGFAGELAAPGVIVKGYQAGQGVIVKTGAKYVPPEEVFSPQVLQQGKTMPTSSSVKESLIKFKETQTSEGYIVGTTAAPSKLKGVEAGLGKKGAVGLEDPGIYVTPKGETSPYFLRTGPGMSYDYSFNVKDLFVQSFGTPTVTEFRAAGVSRLPKNVLTEPGFGPVKTFFEENPNQGIIYITKRSEIGQGTITGQKTTITSNFKLGTAKYKAGNTVPVSGTSELEGIVPYKQTFVADKPTSNFISKIKGYEEYTVYNDRPVAIRKTTLVQGGSSAASEGTIISVKKIQSGSKALSSVAGERYSNPYSVIGATGISVGDKVTTSNISVGKAIKKSSTITSNSSSPASYIISVTKVSSSNKSKSSKSSQSSKSSSSSMSSSITSSPISSSSYISSPSSVVTSKSSYPGKSSSYISKVSRIGYSSGYSSGYNPGFPRTPPTSVLTRPKKEENDSFGVLVRREGKFGLVGSGLSLNKAKSLLKSKVEGTAAASGKIIKGGQVIKIKPFAGFYASKGEEGVIIEKPGRRIKSLGELQEITYKGIGVNRRKSRGGFF